MSWLNPYLVQSFSSTSSKKDKGLKNIIKHLVSLKKEGQYWDFKLKYPDKSLDLVKDIIAMGNCEHDGDRYLIYGVNNHANIVKCQLTLRVATTNIADLR